MPTSGMTDEQLQRVLKLAQAHDQALQDKKIASCVIGEKELTVQMQLSRKGSFQGHRTLTSNVCGAACAKT